MIGTIFCKDKKPLLKSNTPWVDSILDLIDKLVNTDILFNMNSVN